MEQLQPSQSIPSIAENPNSNNGEHLLRDCRDGAIFHDHKLEHDNIRDTFSEARPDR